MSSRTPGRGTPGRVIGMTYGSVSGMHPGLQPGVGPGVPFESTLERDFLEIVCFDGAGVTRLEAQPCTIPLVAPGRRGPHATHYTPDYLVARAPRRLGAPYRTTLYEVKPREKLLADVPHWRARFRAARAYAAERFWRFRVVSELQIRTPYLANVRFLQRFRRDPRDHQAEAYVLGVLDDFGQTPLDALLPALAATEHGRLGLLPIVWRLVADRRVEADLTQPLRQTTALWLSAGEEAAGATAQRGSREGWW